MKIEEIRKNAPDATHYFLWCGDAHIFKRSGKKWKWLVNDIWTGTELLNIYWLFGWRCETKHLGGPSHKLKPL